MSLKTDDQDIRDVRMFIETGGNGDYYINLMEMKKVCFDGSGKPSKENARISMRIATSGGNAPHEVMMAVANLYKAMQQHGLNEHPLND